MSRKPHSETTCPVAKLAIEFDALVKAFNTNDRAKLACNDSRHDQAKAIIWERMEAIREEASWLTPSSDIGAAFQIMQADVQLSLVTDTEGYEQRRLETQMTRLLYRATDHLLRAGNSLPDARQFSMSDRLDPREAIVAALAGKTVQL